MTHHFLLTRFNLPLWKIDKTNKTIDRKKWLEERMMIFETYCLPSLASQTSKDFTWIILFDKNTPENIKEKFKAYKDKCPQIVGIYVNKEAAWHFCEIFIQIINRCLERTGFSDGDTILTTYLDNDDALNVRFVEDVQQCAEYSGNGTVINYDKGCQYFSKYDVLADVTYCNNHFLTVKEVISSKSLHLGIRTCYGYGSHAFIEKKKMAKVCHIKTDIPMWLELVHNGNVINDVNIKFHPHIRTNDPDTLKREFGLNKIVRNTNRVYYYLHVFVFTVKKIIKKLMSLRS